jgi:hypothetical protein
LVISSGQNPGSVLFVDDLDLSGGNVGMRDPSTTENPPFPNPAQDHITLPRLVSGARVSVLDASGRLVLERSATSTGPMNIPVQDLVPGTYVIRVNAARTEERFGFVKGGSAE